MPPALHETDQEVFSFRVDSELVLAFNGQRFVRLSYFALCLDCVLGYWLLGSNNHLRTVLFIFIGCFFFTGNVSGYMEKYNKELYADVKWVPAHAVWILPDSFDSLYQLLSAN